MARIRTIKPEILEDEKTSALSDTAFRLFVSMIALADDHGNVRADVRWLSGQIWWQHEPKPNVLLALVELSRSSLLSVYGVRGGTYATLIGWTKHQRIDNAGKGKVPQPDDPDSQLVKVDEHGLEVVAGTRNPILPGLPRVAESRGDPLLDQEGRGKGEGEESAAKPPRRPPKHSGSLPAGWEPSAEDRARAAALGLDLDRELEKFRNYHAAKGSRRADWDAAWRSWISKAQDFAPSREPNSPREIPEL